MIVSRDLSGSRSWLLRLLAVLLASATVLAAHAQEEFSPDVIARFHINNGKFLIDEEDFLSANLEFTTADEMAQSPALKSEALAWMGQLRSTFLDDVPGAIQEYELVISDSPRTEFYRQSLLQLGMLNYQNQKLDPAKRWLSRFLKEFPNDPQAATAQFLLEDVNQHIKENTLPPAIVVPAIGNIIRIGLGAESTVVLRAPIFTARSLHREFRGEVELKAIKGRLMLGSEDLGPTALDLETTDPFHYKNRSYRGRAEILAKDDDVQVVNILPLELYLYSVVGAEVSPTWKQEALKSQAVAARSYAAFAIGHPIRQDFDLFDDVRSQAYSGVGSERDATRKAVESTTGEVLEFDGKPVDAYFMANNGGWSASSKDVFDIALPYFQVQEDNYSRLGPMGHWERHFTAAEIRSALSDFGFRVGAVTDLRISSKDSSGRAKQLEVVSGADTLRIRCRNQFRVSLNRYTSQHNSPENVPDTLLAVTRAGDVYTLSGGGWGHGVGMSQEGAKARAEAGQDYKMILSAYYPGAQVVKLY